VHTESGRDIAGVDGERLGQLGGDHTLAAKVVTPEAGNQMSAHVDGAPIGDVTDLEAGRRLGLNG
jgi:hypothetical protein